MTVSTGRSGGGPGAVDRLVALACFAFCALVYGMTYQFDTVPEALMSGLGPEIFPRMILIMMAGLAVLAGLGIGILPLGALPPVAWRVWATGAVLFAFLGAVALIGMWISAFLALVGLGWMWGERRVGLLVLSAAVQCGALYLLFVRFLGVSFPRSVLTNLWS